MITAIIAEYNPFTNGHAYHIEVARRETGADTILAIMSGSFTERGDAAIADKYLRAKIAVENGADVVIELPLIYAISPADDFAYGALKTLKDIKEVECLSFGSECGDIDMLLKTADILTNEPEELSNMLKEKMSLGYSYPKARAEAFDKYVSGIDELQMLTGILDNANNILGIAYICAAKKMGYDIKFHTVKRVGADYNDDSLITDVPSASGIRKAMFEHRFNEIAAGVPEETYSLLVNYRGSTTALGDMILFKLKKTSGYELLKYHGFSEGLHNRLKIAAETSSTYEEFLEKAKTKKYTMARIKRLTLNLLFDITEDFYQQAKDLPSFQHVLSIKKERMDILSKLSYLPNLMVRYSDSEKKIDKSIKPIVKMDWEAQGVLSVINRDSTYNKSMIIVE